MKKFFSILAASVLAFSFTACEDVDNPYDLGGGGADKPASSVKELPYSESFATSFGAFENYTTSGGGAWIIDFGTAKASGYDFDAKKNTAGVYYLVSPEISLKDQTEVHVSYEYILAYKSRFPEGDKLYITDLFNKDEADQNWTELEVDHKEAQRTSEGKVDWKTFNTMDVQIPEEFLGKNVRIAFRHECDDKGSTTLEVKNFNIEVGKAEGGEDKPEAGVQELPYKELFASDLGLFQNYTSWGSGSWESDSRGFAKASGFTAKDQPAVQGEYFLVSPEISLNGKTEAHLSYEYINSFNDNPLNHQFMVNVSFDEKNPSAGWVALKADHEKTSTWTDWKKADIQIPSEYMGKNIRVAFFYSCRSDRASTFEVKNFSAAEGKAEGGDTPDVKPGDAIFSAAMSNGLDGMTNYLGTDEWKWEFDSNYSCAKVSGHVGGKDGYNVAGQAYLVSPEISLENVDEAHVTYESAIGYMTVPEDHQVLISANFNESAPAEGWTVLKGGHEQGDKFFAWMGNDVQVPAEMLGKKVRIAFRYSCNSEKVSTWEVRNLKVLSGKASEGGNEGGGDTPDTGDVTTSNGDFETWVDGMPNKWKSECTASKGNLFQSKDAHGGNFSVQVSGSSSQNMRLAYQETTLKAGKYTLTFFVKAVTPEGGSVCPGYVKVTNGSVGSYMYKKVDGKMAYEDNLSNSEWRKVEYSFDLSEEGTYCLVVMNGKNPGHDVLIDDFTLTAEDGTAIIK